MNNILNRDNSRLYDGDDLCAEIDKFFQEQKSEWEFLKFKFDNLAHVEVREIKLNDISIILQFNPDRIHSTAADIDKHLVTPKECFLCSDNRPKEQRGIKYGKYFEILCNPFPIFKDHLTILKLKHTPQSLVLHLNEFLYITRDLGEKYTLFYNGPRCGASAPGHMHFQAITKGILPVEKDFDSLKNDFVPTRFTNDKISVNLCKNYLRYFISIESESNKEITLFIKSFNNILKKISPRGQEPLMNVLANYENGYWRLIIFPRAKHRPSQYFETGARQLIVSPAAVDLGGMFITPRKEDYDKITKEDVLEIFRQVSVTREQFDYLQSKLV